MSQPELLQPREKELLQIILDRMLNDPNGLDIRKFRMELLNDRKIIDWLNATQLIRTNRGQSQYRISLVGMHLADSDLSAKVFNDIDRICDVLRDHYQMHADLPIAVRDIQKITGLDYRLSCVLFRDALRWDKHGHNFRHNR